MVGVLATASLLRAFQPRSSDSIHSVYSDLRSIHATQSHPTPADICTVVVRCEAAERECARAEGVGLAEGEARAAKRPQGPAREPKRSELIYFPKMRSMRCRLSQIDRQTSDLVLESKFTSRRGALFR